MNQTGKGKVQTESNWKSMARLKFDVHTRSLSNVSFGLLCKEYLTKLSVFKRAGLDEKRVFHEVFSD